MSIAAAIAALSPSAYWKLDDPTGPAASDSSGHARPGVYNGSFVLGKVGPEAGSGATQLTNPASVVAVNPPYMNALPFTLLCYATFAAPPPSLSALLVNNSNTTGAQLSVAPSGNTIGQLEVDRNGQGSNGLNFFILDGEWHQYALTVGTFWSVYVDGVQVGAATATTNTPVPTQLGVGSRHTGLFAHFAAWNGVQLLPAALAGIIAAESGPRTTPYYVSGGATQSDVYAQLVDQTALLNAILDAVTIRAY